MFNEISDSMVSNTDVLASEVVDWVRSKCQCHLIINPQLCRFFEREIRRSLVSFPNGEHKMSDPYYMFGSFCGGNILSLGSRHRRDGLFAATPANGSSGHYKNVCTR